MTIKAIKAMQGCEVVIYAGSLINKEVLKYAMPQAEIYDSSAMNLDEIVDVMLKAHGEGKNVARLHTGDPTIYGAIQEQIVRLKGQGVKYEIIPGVSSFLAAAAVLKKELTVPEITQTVIITRIGGRTKVSPKQEIGSLAKHNATMAIFLSVQEIDRVVGELLSGYDQDTPVAVVYKATWEDQAIIMGRLDNISDKVRSRGINRTALILVGDFLKDTDTRSKLYDGNFYHSFRKKKNC